ncbi:MAG: ABC transporter permease [Sphingomonadales bacterium]|jgi:ABC-2 type transport system permease protein|nr:ABC transporter permease [Sphingomonadales bacterium]MBK9002541.1 ABC transporter permease [Sphingomonadales bacterium]MBK9267761.1 ABC transporter permease [Sphingomonadales bacterium]MBP6433438.1 ABC transporter permease [Sphingorhabdus sp.]
MIETIRAAFVIGRRDFTAIIFSKAFFFFLLGPMFPLLVGGAAGLLGGQVARDIDRPVVGVAMSAEDSRQLLAARSTLAAQIGERRLPELKQLAQSAHNVPPEKLLDDKANGLAAVLGGTLEKPILTGTRGPIESYQGEVAMLSAFAMNADAMALPPVETRLVQRSAGNEKQQRLVTAQATQVLLFMLTMLLAGMVLSNLVEEKANKIIEILAAAVPMDSVFLGKLFAMLAMAFVGIAVWTTVGFGLASLSGPALPSLPTPAVGWPVFVLLGVVYFTMAYLILGSLFLGIGAMAATVREVQTLSMPVTMAQLINFFFAMYTVTKLGEPIELFACLFPFTSPFAMIARAAQDATLWPHLLAVVWQALFVLIILRVGVYLFRRNVMKSGSAGRIKETGGKKLFGLVKLPG